VGDPLGRILTNRNPFCFGRATGLIISLDQRYPTSCAGNAPKRRLSRPNLTSFSAPASFCVAASFTRAKDIHVVPPSPITKSPLSAVCDKLPYTEIKLVRRRPRLCWLPVLKHFTVHRTLLLPSPLSLTFPPSLLSYQLNLN
jgi:hypothetical protein